MKTMYYLYATLLVCLPIACNKVEELNDIPEQPSAKITYIQANGNEENTKGSVDGSTAAFTWNTGDQIAVYADGYKISDPLGDSYDETPTNVATFAFSGDNVVTEESRTNFAIYPASLVYDGSGNPYTTDVKASSLKLNLPASYTLAQVQDNVSPTPMIASNAPNGNLAFKALCPLLRISLVGVPKAATEVLFDFDGKKVQGEFTLKEVTPASTAITTTTTAGDDDIITVTGFTAADWTPTTTINLPVPAGTYHYVTITAKDGSDVVANETISIRANNNDWEATRVSSRKRSYSFGTIAGLCIAPGNLYTDADGNPHIAANAYSNISWNVAGIGEENYSINNRSLFNFNEVALLMQGIEPTWSTSQVDRDGFPSLTRSIDGGNWRVPSSQDFIDWLGRERSSGYIAPTRPGATVVGANTYNNVQFIKVMVTKYEEGSTYLGYTKYVDSEIQDNNNPRELTTYQTGVILFPDGATINIGAEDVLDGINSDNTGYHSIEKSVLDKLLAAKCAFLPCLGRYHSTNIWTKAQVGVTAVYWTSSNYSGNPETLGYRLNMQSGKIGVNQSAGKKGPYYMPVRLVK